ncbi:hypothetical protein [Pseudomonas fluorescens]|uniref:hypothetical protein n=1 Tax=Pseudomonas fluorescens TaxID=294 RepID=UPI000F4A5E37|nr:hypothetical protein [Pseudomonas fluorescens]RON90349.1 hypothetical protein BK668_11640 [Pseudomonas fluorescens]
MQIAILLVLIVIACMLGPWLIGVIVAAVAIYGLAVVLAILAALVVLPLLAFALWFLRWRSGYKTPAQVMAERNAAFNRKYLEEAEAKRNKECLMVSQTADLTPSIEDQSISKDGIICVRCSNVYRPTELVCPSCGKTPPKNGS